MLQLVIIIAIAFALQIVLSMAQMKHFANEFCKLRRQGKVACGRKAGGFHAGAIVMFLIDDDGMVKQAKKIEGITFLARVKDMKGFEGRDIRTLSEKDVPKGHKNLGRAVADASLTFRKYTAGEVIPEPPSPFRKAGNAVTSVFHKTAVS
ncbi:MAG: transcriptional regulator GutM [Lachnospiraceae bacterium]|nr:transcriptional regulator GutM [Lachnospiraceae bacterium]